ncbi:MAG TPA: phage tail sheath C-terminal domain-containing protein [Bacteroidia bacterium]|nr:phage tail sheath C-terminal domain-containing protein [Bacteroidia bacterium]
MATYKTPGVYIEEIPRLPSSVAAVPTSVPVFIGYTAKVEVDGEVITAFPTNPIRIESLLQFETIFGGPKNETFAVTLTGPDVNIAVASTPTSYRLYYNMLMYFGNGGGPCYIIAAGSYSTSITEAGLRAGIPKAEQVDEITMVVVPEAIMLGTLSARRNVYNDMLAHCAQMQDRFSLMDVEVILSGPNTIQNDADQFRNLTVGANNLSYGATYYPSYKPSFPFSYIDTGVTVTATAANLPASVKLFGATTLDVINSGTTADVAIDLSAFTFPGVALDTLTINSIPFDLTLYNDVGELYDALVADAVLGAALNFAFEDMPVGIITLTAAVPGTQITFAKAIATPAEIVFSPASSPQTGLAPDKVLYNRIKAAVDGYAMELYPSAMMAGVYCAVDTARGVWKAPANVGITLVDSLNRTVKNADQENLNVDPTSGKSIDVLRDFPGRGLLVWGARTMDGNSNEWRYISVRRTFLFIEDSCKKATMFSVFEPNDMNTWLRIQGMISSFLTTIWRDGGLAGAKPEQAFFVKVGLGQTMTAQDILEGRLIVQIGLAVVRPAEFVILRFEHMVQTS